MELSSSSTGPDAREGCSHRYEKAVRDNGFLECLRCGAWLLTGFWRSSASR